MLSLIMPMRPLGSAAETATPAMSGLCKSNFHSSGVKSAFAATRASQFARVASMSENHDGFASRLAPSQADA
jgi:hypothetical protein